MVNRQKPKNKTGIYTKIVGFFMFLTIVAIFVILHFALAKVTIKVVSPTTTESYSGLVEMLPENSLEATTENILGKIITKELELTTTVPTEPEAKSATKAGGYVTIINNYSQNQPLVATTRLLTPDNKLYRIQTGVTVPAGSSVEVWAQADEEGEQYIIGETKLTIPGLWSGLQDKIYAETKGFSLASEPIYQVTEDTLAAAQEKLATEAINQGLTAFNELLAKNLQIGKEQIFANYETLESSAVGEETAETSLKQKVTLYGLVFSPADLQAIAEKKFQDDLESNQKLTNLVPGTFHYQILEMYPEQGRAIIEVKLDGQVMSSQHLLKINKDELIGKTENDIREYLQQFNIESSEVKFFPFWIKTVPKLKDHIIIE